MNWKLIAIIAATAVATAAAVVFMLQKQNRKHKRLFDSEEFDNEEFDLGRGEQCNYLDDLDVELPEDIAEDVPQEAVAAEEEIAVEEEEETETK